jgi:glycosyltransferase involved in cell wall biosynthesis
MVDRLGADLYHSMFAFQPLRMQTPGLITLHDIMWLRHPWLQSAGKPLRLVAGWAYHRLFAVRCMARAGGVIVPTRAVQREVSGMWGHLTSKLTLVEEGVDRCFLGGGAAVDLSGRNPLPARVGKTRFFLHLTNAHPYKNSTRLLRAFRAVARHEKVRMVMVGRRSAFSESLLSEVDRLGLEGRVVWLGSVSNRELAELFRTATALLFPSLCEGFGLPVVEAMASGCPVMTANRGALAEVAGGAALCVDPWQVDAMAQGMKRLLGSERLRNTLRQRGMVRAAGYTWETAGRKVVALYRVLGRKRL